MKEAAVVRRKSEDVQVAGAAWRLTAAQHLIDNSIDLPDPFHRLGDSRCVMLLIARNLDHGCSRSRSKSFRLAIY